MRAAISGGSRVAHGLRKARPSSRMTTSLDKEEAVGRAGAAMALSDRQLEQLRAIILESVERERAEGNDEGDGWRRDASEGEVRARASLK